MKKETKKYLKKYVKEQTIHRKNLKEQILKEENIESVIVGFYEQYLNYAKQGKTNQSIPDYESLLSEILVAINRDTVLLTDSETKLLEDKVFEVLCKVHKDFTKDFKIVEHWKKLSENKNVDVKAGLIMDRPAMTIN